MDAGKRCLKLILSVDALSPSLSGIGRYTWELASRLKIANDIEQIRYFRAGQWVDNPASLLCNKFTVSKGKLKYPRWAKDWYWQRACRGQIFHAPNYFLPPYAENGVVTVHDLSVFKYPEAHPIERIKQFEKTFQQTLSIAEHLITDSEATRLEVITYFNWPSERITAIHLGVSDSFAPKSATQINPTLRRYNLNYKSYSLCVSTIEPRKQIDKLLTAYAMLPKKILDDFPLVLVGGKGWHSEHLHIEIESAQKAGWLLYLGFIDEADLPAIYAGAQLFVYPSIYEGFGLPIAEAMASGVPVVTSNRSTLLEIASGAARLVDPEDIDALSMAIEESISTHEWRREAIVQGLSVSKKYNWDQCINHTVKVYNKVLFGTDS